MVFLKKMLKKTFLCIISLVAHASKHTIIHNPKWVLRFRFVVSLMQKSGKCNFGSYFVTFSKCRLKIETIKTALGCSFLKIYKEYFLHQSDKHKFFLYKIYYLLGLFDKEFFKIVVQYAKNTNEFSYKYWITQDLTYIIFRNPEFIYNSYYDDRKALFFSLSKSIGKDFLKINNDSYQGQSVCVLAFTGNGKMSNSMQRVASMVANGLAKTNPNLKISVVFIDSFALPPDNKHFYSLFPLRESIFYKNDIRKLFDDRINLFYPSRLDVKERMKWVLGTIFDINPSIILDITDDTSPSSCLYHSFFPTVFLPLRGGGISSFYTKILGPTIRYKKINSVDDNKVVEFCFPEYVPPIGPVYSRQDYNIGKDDFVIVTIGTGYGFEPDFIRPICNLLYKYQNIKWVLIGFSATPFMKETFKELFDDKRIIEHGYEKNLMSFCKISNLCLRPNTTSGSGGTAIAAMSRLPIVMTNYICDPMRWLGHDYSNINSYEGLAKEVEKMYLDPSYYSKKSEEAFEKVSKVTDADACWRRLDLILKEISQLSKHSSNS